MSPPGPSHAPDPMTLQYQSYHPSYPPPPQSYHPDASMYSHALFYPPHPMSFHPHMHPSFRAQQPISHPPPPAGYAYSAHPNSPADHPYHPPGGAGPSHHAYAHLAEAESSFPTASPLFGVTELHDPPLSARASLGAHSRTTSTSTIPSTHSAQSGDSEYTPSAPAGKARSRAVKGKAKVQALGSGSKASRPKRQASSSTAPPPVPVVAPDEAETKPARTKRVSKPSAKALPAAPESPLSEMSDIDEDDTYPPSNIVCENVRYPILEAPVGTTYSVNNYVILIPADYAPPGTDIIASEFEQYSCRLCRKTYSGKNARSVARRHLQDKHAVRLELQERRSRWDRSEAEKDERNRANKAEWARKHRLAEKERIESALQRDQPILPRPKRGKNKRSTTSSSTTSKRATSAAPQRPFRRASYGPSATLNSLADLPSPSSSTADAADVGDMSDGTTLAILHGTASWTIDKPVPSPSAEDLETLIRQSATEVVVPYDPHTESPLSSSPDLAVLGAHQQWAVPDGWHDMTANQMISWMTFPHDQQEAGPSASAHPEEEAPAPLKPKELAAESLLNLHSSPSRHADSTPRPVLSRPSTLRRFTLGSSSSSGGVPTSAPSVGGYRGLETPILLRPAKSRWADENVEPTPAVEGQKRATGRGRLALGERSLSFSAITPKVGLGGEDDPFVTSPPTFGVVERRTKDQAGEAEEIRGEKRGLDGSPVPARKRHPLNPILPNSPSSSFAPIFNQNPIGRHHSSSSLSSTLVAPHTNLQTIISPLKRQTASGSATYATPVSRRERGGGRSFGMALFGKTPGTVRATPVRAGRYGRTREERGGEGEEEGERDSGGEGGDGRWALSSPAGGSGMAAELGLVGAYGYVGGLETPMRGVVESETPVRE